MRFALPLSLVFLVVGCASSSSSEDGASSAAAETESQQPSKPPIDCGLGGGFPEASVMGLGGTYVRDGVTPPGHLESFTVGPLQDIEGWAGKSADYTRTLAGPCSGECTASGKLTSMMDNPAIGAFMTFDKSDFYFVTGSKLENGVTTALCLVHAVAPGETFLVKRQ